VGVIALDISLAAVAPIVVAAIAFVVFCWVDIARHDVRHLPKWAWAVICVFSVPLGGVIYLIVGRGESSHS
jgi:hypothetical protein